MSTMCDDCTRFDTKEKAVKKCKELKKMFPDTFFSVIKSENWYYVEEGVPFIRVWEDLVYKTK